MKITHGKNPHKSLHTKNLHHRSSKKSKHTESISSTQEDSVTSSLAACGMGGGQKNSVSRGIVKGAALTDITW